VICNGNPSHILPIVAETLARAPIPFPPFLRVPHFPRPFALVLKSFICLADRTAIFLLPPMQSHFRAMAKRCIREALIKIRLGNDLSRGDA